MFGGGILAEDAVPLRETGELQAEPFTECPLQDPEEVVSGVKVSELDDAKFYEILDNLHARLKEGGLYVEAYSLEEGAEIFSTELTEEGVAADSFGPRRRVTGTTAGMRAASGAKEADGHDAFSDWDVPAAELTIEGIQKGFSIDSTIQQARDAERELERALARRVEAQPVVYDILSDQDMIRSVIPEEHLLQKIDMEFDMVPVSSIMRTLGSAVGVNIMVDPKVGDQQMSVQLKDIFLEEALTLIARSQKLGYEKVGNALYVASREDLDRDREVSRVVRLQNIKAAQAQIMIRDFVRSVGVSEELNSLIITGSAEQVIKAVNVLMEVDIPQAQVILEAKIIEIAKDAMQDLGVDWTDRVSLDFQESQRLRELDDPMENVPSPFNIYRITRNALSFSADINLLEKKGKARILSNPRITTMNEKPAMIFVGEKYPYVVSVVDGGTTTESVQFEHLGIALRITPSIIEDEFVVVQVEPEVSYITGFVGDYPRVNSRSAVTHVRIKNQQPFVIGGLLDQKESTVVSKVPFLGSLPMLGKLFTSDATEVKNSELLIVVIPTIVRGDY